MEFWLWWFCFVFFGIFLAVLVKIKTKELSFKEMVLTIAFSMIGGTVVVLGGKYQILSDTEILNGYVISKAAEEVHCSHSYPCNCQTISVGGHLSTSCETCYKHLYDLDYVVYSNIGSININRVDSQGLIEPPRFKEVIIGEPFAKENTFTNYIKAAPNSLFNEDNLNSNKSIFLPKYPKVYDYYRINRVVLDENVSFNASKLNDLFNNSLKTIGKEKKNNIVLVVTKKEQDDFQNYFRYVKAKWYGGKQNDVVVILGIDDSTQIKYVNTFSFSKSEIINVKINSDIKNLIYENLSLNSESTQLKVHEIIIDNINKYFERRSMEDFKYLEDEIDPPLWLIVMGLIISCLGTPSLLFYFTRKNVDI